MKGLLIRLARVFGILLGVWLSSTNLLQAALFVPIPPESLEQRAELVCNASVLSIEKAGPPQDFIYSSLVPASHREVIMRARIHVLHVFKGVALPDLEFQYQSSIEHGDIYLDHPYLQKGRRYRFFLRFERAPDIYVGVLNRQYNDGRTVEPLCANEPDDSPYLHREEVVTLAQGYAQSKKLESKLDWKNIFVDCNSYGDGTNWTVMFFHKPGASDPGHIVVRGDRTIDLQNTTISGQAD